jgi:hypothetical protein
MNTIMKMRMVSKMRRKLRLNLSIRPLLKFIQDMDKEIEKKRVKTNSQIKTKMLRNKFINQK